MLIARAVRAGRKEEVERLKGLKTAQGERGLLRQRKLHVTVRPSPHACARVDESWQVAKEPSSSPPALHAKAPKNTQ